jgi:Ser/Thr protein kinase RdoA (MazF antagonist)
MKSFQELTWLAALSREAGLPVPAPVSAPDRRLLVLIITPGVPHGRHVSLLRWLDGQRLDQDLRLRHLKALGQVAARLHAFSTCWQPPVGFARFHWD